ncbi:MAG TPA: DNA-3-methyladenine glycosylase 2 family protein [Chitinophagaceae bacterium]|nr:DNA-3-methyladenine glycosylase 2 family protein [Chitinophagaceae bacterium]
MSQQLSTKVAEVIFNRFLQLFGEHEPTPQQIASTSHEALRSIGLSSAKADYTINVANFILEHRLHDDSFHSMTDEEIINLLTQIKGVGRWTVEMLLMFTLGREDVFAPDDYGIQTSMAKLYRLDPTNKKELMQKMLMIASKWSPYKTYACMHLWRWKDLPPG